MIGATEEVEVEAGPNATNAVDSAILLETATRLAQVTLGLSATVATREGTWLEIAPRVIARPTWSVTSAMKSVILPRSAKVIHV